VQTVRGWIEALPAEVREAHPRLLFLLAVCIGRRGRLVEAIVLLERSAEGFARVGDAAGRGEALAQLASAALMEGEAARALALAEEALSLPLKPESRVQLLLERARTRLWSGEPSRATGDLDAALELGAGPADAVVLAALLTHLHPIFTALPAGVDRVERVCRLVTTCIGDQAGPLQATLHGQWALVHLCRGRFDVCLEAGEWALALRERYGSANRLLDIWTVSSVAMVHAARAEHTEAQRYIDLMFQQFAELGLGPAQRSAGLYLWGWASWLAGDADTAREAHQQMAEAGSGIPATPILRAMLAGLLSMAERHYAAAEEHLRRAIALNRGVPPVDLHGNPRLLLAHLYLMTGRPGRAMAEFEPVLEACEAADTPGLILKEGTPMLPLLRVAVERGVAPAFASRLLELAGAARKPRPVQLPETGETLSAREIEVLRLLATGAGNREIAAELVIGEQTVKTHVAHILQKLDVPSRRQATLRARQLGLI
jgi:ATP/maltotriose-dependent transcriptional regulator MalT